MQEMGLSVFKKFVDTLCHFFINDDSTNKFDDVKDCVQLLGKSNITLFCLFLSTYGPLATACYDSFINHFPSAIFHQPFSINHSPSTIFYQPFSINHFPSTIFHQPFSINHSPSTIFYQPFSVNHFPSTIFHQPFSVNHFQTYPFRSFFVSNLLFEALSVCAI